MRNMYSGFFNRYWESIEDKRTATINPTIEKAKTILKTVFCVDEASSFWFFTKFSEVNFVRAVFKFNTVRRENVEARKLIIERIPISV